MTKNLCFSIGTNLYIARTRDNGYGSKKQKVGNILKLENAAVTYAYLLKIRRDHKIAPDTPFADQSPRTPLTLSPTRTVAA